MGDILKSRTCGAGECISDTWSKNCEAALLGCWGRDDSQLWPGLVFAQWEVGLREMTWEAELGRLLKSCCVTNQEKNNECCTCSIRAVLSGASVAQFKPQFCLALERGLGQIS